MRNPPQKSPDEERGERFARLRKAAAENAGNNELSPAEAEALVDEIRQELFDTRDEKSCTS